MNSVVKIVKRSNRENNNLQIEHQDETGRQGQREIVSRRRTEPRRFSSLTK